jgi:hypothetical protein
LQSGRHGFTIGSHHAGLEVDHAFADREGGSGLGVPDGSESTPFPDSDDVRWWCG